MSQPFQSGFKHRLLPFVIHGLGDAVPSAKLSDGFLTLQPFKHHLHFCFGCPPATFLRLLSLFAHHSSLSPHVFYSTSDCDSPLGQCQPFHGVIILECDGETYHSARSIKERDRLREERLVALGWNIYRIWSIDWFHDPEREINRLITYLNGLRKQSNVGDVALRDPEPVSDKKQNLKDFTADAGRETAAALEKAEAIKVSMEAEPGVTIILSFADNPDIFHTFTYSDQGEDLSQGLLAVDSPLGQRLINARIKDPIEVNWGGERRKVIVHEKKLPKYKPKKRFEPDSWRYW